MGRHKLARPEPGTIEDTAGTLAVWARHTPRGLARVETVSEESRYRVVERLKQALADLDVPLHEIELPARRPAVEAVRELVERLQVLEPGVVSLSGFSTAFSEAVPLADSLRVLNSQRENLASAPHRQIWWMFPEFVNVFVHAAPDLDSWFLIRLQLTEVVDTPEPLQQSVRIEGNWRSLEEARRIEGNWRSLEEARRLSNSLLDRLGRARASSTPARDWIDLALGAIQPLQQAGAIREAGELADRLFSDFLATSETRSSRDPESARVLNELARLYLDLGRFDEAARLYHDALAIQEDVWGDYHHATCSTLFNLARLLMSQGRLDEAEGLLVRAKHASEFAYGLDHPDTAPILNNLAAVLVRQGRLSEALTLVQRAVQVCESVRGPNHPETAFALNSLAALYVTQGRLSEAGSLYNRVLRMLEKSLGADHPFTLTTLHNLGTLRQIEKRYDEAEEILRRSLNARERVLPPNHPDIAVSLASLASLDVILGRLGEAQSLLERAQEICQTSLGEGHSMTRDVRKQLARLQGEM